MAHGIFAWRPGLRNNRPQSAETFKLGHSFNSPPEVHRESHCVATDTLRRLQLPVRPRERRVHISLAAYQSSSAFLNTQYLVQCKARTLCCNAKNAFCKFAASGSNHLSGRYSSGLGKYWGSPCIIYPKIDTRVFPSSQDPLANIPSGSTSRGRPLANRGRKRTPSSMYDRRYGRSLISSQLGMTSPWSKAETIFYRSRATMR